MIGLFSEARVLIVDDEPTNINMLGESLTGDYIVTAANSGEEALRLVEGETKPDLILLDIQMPEMSGFEVCQKIKENKETEDIAVIFITSLDDQFNEEAGFDLGALDYIQKPFSPTNVKARVKVHLDNIRYRKLLEFLLRVGTDELQKIDEENREHSPLLNIPKQ